MKSIKYQITIIALLLTVTMNAQIDNILGDWITIDDKANIEASIVHIFKSTNGKYYGRVEKLLVKGYENMICEKCKGELKGKKVAGMIIINNMEYIDGKLQNGYVLDPESGKTYYGKIWYDQESGHLILRGSLDKRGFFGRNQEWIRKKK